MTPSVRLAGIVVAELLAGGVREAVLSPGSRSAPLAYALAAAAEAARLRLHVRVDERTAGFLALGLAKGSGAPVPVVTTSGTAAGNLLPAALEADASGIPLLLLTADRPLTLVDTGANQTTDQVHLFGRHVRADAVLDAASEHPAGWRFQLARLLTAATGNRSHDPGPVHLNLAFPEPLVSDRPVELPMPAGPEVAPMPTPPAPVRLPPGPRTVVVAGDLPPGQGARVAALAEHARLPLLAEPSSNARGSEAALGTYRLLLGSALADQVQRVIVLGHPTLSRPVQRLLSRADVEIVVVTDQPRWFDPGLAARRVVDDVVIDAEPDAEEWLARWRAADAAARAAVDEVIAGGPLSGPRVAAELWAALGSGDTLVVGSSNPIRDLDLVRHRPDVPTVYANRGLAGIDGTVSTAVGIALTASGPTHALLGDLTLLHDATGLLLGPTDLRPNLRIVVANDNGGSIFATLEHGHPDQATTFERVFATPHGADLRALAAAFGVPYARVTARGELPALLAQPPTGIELVEAVVDRRRRREQTEALATIAARL